MLTHREKEYFKEVLKLMSEHDLHMLALTVTNNMIVPVTSQEAIDAILLHSSTPQSLLLRKRLSREILFRYLHDSKVPIIATTDKRTMVHMILQMWNCTSHDNETTTPDDQSLICSSKATNTKPDIQVGEVDEMARQFIHWFYSMLNQHEVPCQGTQLGIEHFWQDCCMSLILNSEMGSSKVEVKNSAENVVKLICDTKMKYNLYFNPNMSHEGVQGKTDVHGLVMVLVCGTLHQQDKCVGLFEQLFGLIRDPSACNNWKIKYTELNLKNRSIVTSLPTLAEGSLLMSITDV